MPVFDSIVIERFWSRVNKNGPVPAHRPELGPCWTWIGWLNSDGYGQFKLQNPPRWIRPNRFVWIVEHGPIEDGLKILHACDNASCVRSSHLFIGTQLDNMKDKKEKNRQAKKESHGMVKLTEVQAIEIRDRLRHKKKGDMLKIMKEFSLGRTTVYQVMKGKRWN